MSPLKILIVDDHEAVRSGLRTLLSSSEWIISGEASDGFEAVEKTRSVRPESELGQSLLPMIRSLVEEKQAALSERELRLP